MTQESVPADFSIKHIYDLIQTSNIDELKRLMHVPHVRSIIVDCFTQMEEDYRQGIYPKTEEQVIQEQLIHVLFTIISTIHTFERITTNMQAHAEADDEVIEAAKHVSECAKRSKIMIENKIVDVMANDVTKNKKRPAL